MKSICSEVTFRFSLNPRPYETCLKTRSTSQWIISVNKEACVCHAGLKTPLDTDLVPDCSKNSSSPSHASSCRVVKCRVPLHNSCLQRQQGQHSTLVAEANVGCFLPEGGGGGGGGSCDRSLTNQRRLRHHWKDPDSNVVVCVIDSARPD